MCVPLIHCLGLQSLPMVQLLFLLVLIPTHRKFNIFTHSLSLTFHSLANSWTCPYHSQCALHWQIWPQLKQRLSRSCGRWGDEAVCDRFVGSVAEAKVEVAAGDEGGEQRQAVETVTVGGGEPLLTSNLQSHFPLFKINVSDAASPYLRTSTISRNRSSTASSHKCLYLPSIARTLPFY